VSSVAPLHRTLEQELQALLRGASLECLVCGEFVLHRAGMITCPECSASLRAGNDLEQAQLQFDSQAG
jgi:Zn finger protein HypA/HybF involved in hydrogenase expression